ncbi:MAG: hypothetical protein ACYTGH_03475 [Planctomycetota bacterium]|jgi:hypothetical protein
MNDQTIPEGQIDLRLASIREIFHHVDELSAERLSDRQIFDAVRNRVEGYSDSFVRWLVRHTLHPESEDDLMPDEVVSEELRATPFDYSLLCVTFKLMPPTVRPYHLIQYRQQFWHVVEVDHSAASTVLRPLGSYDL